MKTLILVLFAAFTVAKTQTQSACGRAPATCPNSIYRSYDGSCNNLKNPKWGTPFSAYARIAQNSYYDGVHSFPRDGRKEIINARDLSLQTSPDVNVKSLILTLINMQYGQALAHDMSFTAQQQTRLTCCTNGEPVPSNLDSRCAPIDITENDQYNYPEGNTCFNFVRTASNKDQQCTVPGKVEEPLTSVTSVHDLSILYGSNEERAKSLRTFVNGTLTSVVRNGLEWLSQNTNPSACNVQRAGEPCYFTGDDRVNQHPHLAILQTLILRDHNRIALTLATINPHWDDERCFQEARRILIAKAQHITYYAFLPNILGLENMVKGGLIYPNVNELKDDYDATVNPQILVEHATAAFRTLHSLIVGELEILSENRTVIGTFRLSSWLNRPSLIEDMPAGIVRGLCTQAQNEYDRFYDDEIIQYFNRGNKTLGSDLHATDMQRSRDHGVATYADMLCVCGLGRPKSFSDLKYIKKSYVEILKKDYKNVGDVELGIGGLLETKEQGALVGPTFLCIMMEQFRRTRVGDRFFFENRKTDGAFTQEQITSIRTTSLSQMICDNVDGIESMQTNAFQVISETNPLVPCSSFPREDLSLWKETTDTSK